MQITYPILQHASRCDDIVMNSFFFYFLFLTKSQSTFHHGFLIRCMGTDRSWPEPVIGHLVKRWSHPWEHRCKQFTFTTGMNGCRIPPSLASFKGCQLRRKHLYLEIAALWEFSASSYLRELGKLWVFFAYYCYYYYYQLMINTIHRAYLNCSEAVKSFPSSDTSGIKFSWDMRMM